MLPLPDLRETARPFRRRLNGLLGEPLSHALAIGLNTISEIAIEVSDLGELATRELGTFLRHCLLPLEIENMPAVRRERSNERHVRRLLNKVALVGKIPSQPAGDRRRDADQFGVDKGRGRHPVGQVRNKRPDGGQDEYGGQRQANRSPAD